MGKERRDGVGQVLSELGLVLPSFLAQCGVGLSGVLLMFSCVVFAANSSSQDRVLGGGLEGLENPLALDHRSSYAGDLLCELGPVPSPL